MTYSLLEEKLRLLHTIRHHKINCFDVFYILNALSMPQLLISLIFSFEVKILRNCVKDIPLSNYYAQ